MPSRSLTSSGRPLNSQHNPELYTFFNGAHHTDGTLIALSHAYPDVTVVIADIVGMICYSPYHLPHLPLSSFTFVGICLLLHSHS